MLLLRSRHFYKGKQIIVLYNKPGRGHFVLAEEDKVVIRRQNQSLCAQWGRLYVLSSQGDAVISVKTSASHYVALGPAEATAPRHSLNAV